MLVEVRFAGEALAAMSRTRGVWGLSGAFETSSSSSSARISRSAASFLGLAGARLVFGVDDFLMAMSSPMPSKSSPSSSSVGSVLDRLVAMVCVGGRCASRCFCVGVVRGVE